MVQAIDNLTTLGGTLLRREPHPTLTGYELATLQVERSEPVPGKADLLGHQVGSVLHIAVRTELLGAAQPEARLRLRAKMTASGAMAERDPAPGDFSVEP